MAAPLPVPKHVTRPLGARQITASHPILDFSAWIDHRGKEVLVLKGQVVEDMGEPPRNSVFGLRRVANLRLIAFLKCFYKIDLTPGKK
jgi:hypothetical protein